MRDIGRKEKAINNKNRLVKILRETKHITIAMCSNNKSYSVTLNYGYDSEKNAIYFYCTYDGKKIDILKSNNIIWESGVNRYWRMSLVNVAIFIYQFILEELLLLLMIRKKNDMH